MNNHVTILTKVARPWMLEIEKFNVDNYLKRNFMRGVPFKRLLTMQMEMGWSVAFVAHHKDAQPSTFLALAGVVPDVATKEAEIWFLPAVDMPKYAKSLLKAMPRVIRVFLSLTCSTRGTTLIDPDNENFKKFAKLCKFYYSAKLEIDSIEFEEWEFGG